MYTKMKEGNSLSKKQKNLMNEKGGRGRSEEVSVREREKERERNIHVDTYMYVSQCMCA